jgi:hypothetical protein
MQFPQDVGFFDNSKCITALDHMVQPFDVAGFRFRNNEQLISDDQDEKEHRRRQSDQSAHR